MNAYQLSKQATLEELFDIADESRDIDHIWSVIGETLDQPIEKNASAEDTTARLGTEAVCYSFLKEASTYYGTYEVTDHEQALSDILVKVAEDFVASQVA